MAVGSPVGYSNSIAYGVVTSVTNKISALDNEYNLLTTDILGSTDGSGILVNLAGEIVGIIAQPRRRRFSGDDGGHERVRCDCKGRGAQG